ncbi:hypothetical protein BJV74DRAFT_149979 [Russula compacta]|nr:hypothetical protein BJV74DRAFT_149979 [Russula compacta]
MLPDYALSEIFHHYSWVLERRRWWWWKNLTDVCRSWRHIIFASPDGLDLQLVCTHRTPTKMSLENIWPPFPITISCYSEELDDEGQDNIVAALEHHDRVSEINLRYYAKFSAVTRKSFPILTDLLLSSIDEIAPLLHEEFLGRSTPRLERFTLENIGFPAFPKFAMSAAHLSGLSLLDIPITGYISPEAMATCLATLPSLKWLSIKF